MLLLLGPVFVSMFLNHMFADVPLPDVLVKEPIGLALAVLVIWPADWLADRDLFREVLAAAGAAIVLHSLIGLLQLYSFSKDEFPLLFLYVNPSFMSMQEWGRKTYRPSYASTSSGPAVYSPSRRRWPRRWAHGSSCWPACCSTPA